MSGRCLQGWRGYVIAGLVGAVATAGVLVPVGWLMVGDERRRADGLAREVERAEADRAAAWEAKRASDQRAQDFINEVYDRSVAEAKKAREARPPKD